MQPVSGHTRSSSPQVLELQLRSTRARWFSEILSGRYDSMDCEPPGLPHRTDGTEAERVRMFVNAPGGIPLPPYGSWWMDVELMGPSCTALADFYKEEGLRNADGAGPVDFLPAEMEFLHFLLQHQLAATLTHQDDLIAQIQARIQEFQDRFLLPWVPEFCRKGREITEDPYWVAVFAALEDFLTPKRDRVG